MTLRHFSAPLAALLVAACSSPTIKEPSSAHLMTDKAAASTASAPLPVTQNLAAPKPRPAPKTETYSVVVNNVKVHDLLFALARDARLNVDIHPGISGYVTLNAIDQTLPQLLNRISKQVDMRFEIDGPNLAVMPDTPYLQSYHVNYVNMTREVSSNLSTNTQVVAGGLPGSTGTGNTSAQGQGSAGTSKVQIKNESKNRFWESLEKNIRDILQDTDKERVIRRKATAEAAMTARQSNTNAQASGSGFVGASSASGNATVAGSGNQSVQAQSSLSAQSQNFQNDIEAEIVFAANVIVNAESGVITVRATSRQHAKVQEFIDRVVANARRQVMIEATVIEVELSDGYQQGIDWTRISTSDGFTLKGPTLPSDPTSTIKPFTLTYRNTGSLNILATLNLLEAYGNAKVISSPKLSVLNNQTATLKVSEDVVYFFIKGETTATINTNPIKAYTTTPQTVSVGFFMSITPQIANNGTVTLNVRPSISSIASFVEDPNPDQAPGVKNKVPQIRTREMESVLRLEGGEIAVLGGLMQDTVIDNTGRLPGVGAIPLLGELFTSRNNAARKSELVIFIRPTIINDPSVNGDYSALRDNLPTTNFFETAPVHQPFGIDRRRSTEVPQ